MGTSYEAALDAVAANPELQDQLRAAGSDDEKRAALEAAGVVIPSQDDCHAFDPESRDDEVHVIMGTLFFPN